MKPSTTRSSRIPRRTRSRASQRRRRPSSAARPLGLETTRRHFGRQAAGILLPLLLPPAATAADPATPARFLTPQQKQFIQGIQRDAEFLRLASSGYLKGLVNVMILSVSFGTVAVKSLLPQLTREDNDIKIRNLIRSGENICFSLKYYIERYIQNSGVKFKETKFFDLFLEIANSREQLEEFGECLTVASLYKLPYEDVAVLIGANDIYFVLKEITCEDKKSGELILNQDINPELKQRFQADFKKADQDIKEAKKLKRTLPEYLEKARGERAYQYSDINELKQTLIAYIDNQGLKEISPKQRSRLIMYLGEAIKSKVSLTTPKKPLDLRDLQEVVFYRDGTLASYLMKGVLANTEHAINALSNVRAMFHFLINLCYSFADYIVLTKGQEGEEMLKTVLPGAIFTSKVLRVLENACALPPNSPKRYAFKDIEVIMKDVRRKLVKRIDSIIDIERIVENDSTIQALLQRLDGKAFQELQPLAFDSQVHKFKMYIEDNAEKLVLSGAKPILDSSYRDSNDQKVCYAFFILSIVAELYPDKFTGNDRFFKNGVELEPLNSISDPNKYSINACLGGQEGAVIGKQKEPIRPITSRIFLRDREEMVHYTPQDLLTPDASKKLAKTQ